MEVTGNFAPYTGAWIEIHSYKTKTQPYLVAPYTGAWIEMIISGRVLKSLLIWERGLKSGYLYCRCTNHKVATLYRSVDRNSVHYSQAGGHKL